MAHAERSAGLPNLQLGETLPAIPLPLFGLFTSVPPDKRSSFIYAMISSLRMLPSSVDYDLESIDPQLAEGNRERNRIRREEFARLVTQGVDREFEQDQIGTGTTGDQLYQQVVQTVSNRLTREDIAEGILGLLRPVLRGLP